MNIKLYCC